MDVPDSIVRELVLPVPRERVWAALTEPRGLSAWFGTSASVDLRPGGTVTFSWADQFTNSGIIELVEPLRRFAFRWHAHTGQHAVPPPDAPTTLVEFTLDDDPAGTRLRVVESGFASLSPEYRPARERNSEGWDRELGELAEYLSQAAGA